MKAKAAEDELETAVGRAAKAEEEVAQVSVKLAYMTTLEVKKNRCSICLSLLMNTVK